ncbi:glycosyltransferase [Verrucomicrobia bacterium S94]|nr:glycosyltransferase [Verrucomicrobia bacterium S94]
MKVSVIMPVWNAADTVLQTLETLRSQTYESMEIIVVDDGSTDGTTELLRKQKDILLIERPHRGIVPALNDGLQAAGGTFIARMDADDLCHPKRIEKQVEYLKKHPEIGLVGCCVQFGGDREQQAGYAAYVGWINLLTEPDDIALNRFVESPFAHPSVMFRRALLQECGTYRDGCFPEDYELWLRWMADGVRMGKVKETLLTWNDPPSRLSRTDNRYSVDAFYRIKAGYLCRWLETNNPHYPEVLIWGAGRVTRKRAAILEECGLRITHYIDIKSRRLNCGTPVIRPEEIPTPDSCMVLSMVGNRGARHQIHNYLAECGFVTGKSMIAC